MKRTERLRKEAQRQSLMMMACITSLIIAICTVITGIQNESGLTLFMGGVFTVVLSFAAVFHGTEAWHNLELLDVEIQYQKSNQNQP